VKDADITGQPITGVRYNDRQYTFYPYAGRMVSPKGGLLGYIKTAKGKLHGRFYTRGQWFLFEPAPEGNEPFLDSTLEEFSEWIIRVHAVTVLNNRLMPAR